MYRDVRVHLALNLAGEVADARTAFGAEHRLAVGDKLDPPFAIEPIFFPVREIAVEAILNRVLSEPLGNPPFLLCEAAEPRRNLPRPVAHIERTLIERRHGALGQIERNVASQYRLAQDARKTFRSVYLVDGLGRH